MHIYVYGNKRPIPAGFDEFIDPGSTAIVSIDMHEGHLAADAPCPAPRAREIVDPIDRFHTAARRLGIPIIHVRSVLRRGGVDDINGFRSAWRSTFPLHVGAIPNADEHAIEGTRWTRFVTSVEEGDLTVDTKKRLSPFFATDLELLLRNLRVRSVVLNGGMTDCCVLNACFDAANHDYRVVVPHDLVRGTDPEIEAAALKMVSLHLGLVTDSAELIAEWSRRRDGGPPADRGSAAGNRTTATVRT